MAEGCNLWTGIKRATETRLVESSLSVSPGPEKEMPVVRWQTSVTIPLPTTSSMRD
jgi:hypothetical protein